MSPVRRHFWHVVARRKSSFTLPRKWSLNWFIPAGVNSPDGSHLGTSTSLGRRVCPFDSKKDRYFSRFSSVFMENRQKISHRGAQARRATKGNEGNEGRKPHCVFALARETLV